MKDTIAVSRSRDRFDISNQFLVLTLLIDDPTEAEIITFQRPTSTEAYDIIACSQRAKAPTKGPRADKANIPITNDTKAGGLWPRQRS